MFTELSQNPQWLKASESPSSMNADGNMVQAYGTAPIEPGLWAQNMGFNGQAYGTTPGESGGDQYMTPEYQKWWADNGLQAAYNNSNGDNRLGALDSSGNFIPGSDYSIKDQGNIMRDWLMLVAGGVAGGSALAGAGGAGGAAAGSGAALGNGAFLGEGVASGIGGWDAAAGLGGAAGGAGGAAVGNGAFLGEGAASGVPAWDTAYGLPAAGAGGAGAGVGSGSGSMEFNPEGITNPNFGQGADFAQVSGANGGGMGTSGQWINGINNSSLLSLGGNLLSGYMGSQAANKAAEAQYQAGKDSNALAKYMYDTSRADNQPRLALGNSVLPQISNLLANPNSITSDPGYQFGLAQGTKTLNNGAAAKGMTYSGAQGKALQKFGQEFAGSRLDQSLNRLTNVAGMGQVAVNNNQQAGQNYSNNVGNTLQSMGNSRASGYMGSANAWSGAIGNALNNYNQQSMFDQYLNTRRP